MDNLNPNPNASISDRRDTFVLDRSFILTQGKTLKIGMPYMLLEGNCTKAVRLLKCTMWIDNSKVTYNSAYSLKYSIPLLYK